MQQAGAMLPALASTTERVAAIDWPGLSQDLDDHGNAVIEGLLSTPECRQVADWYTNDALFRSRVVMSRHGFGRGEYKYFSYPLPPLVQALRAAAYPHLAPIANRWHERLGKEGRFPPDHASFLERCHRAGQVRPT